MKDWHFLLANSQANNQINEVIN